MYARNIRNCPMGVNSRHYIVQMFVTIFSLHDLDTDLARRKQYRIPGRHEPSRCKPTGRLADCISLDTPRVHSRLRFAPRSGGAREVRDSAAISPLCSLRLRVCVCVCVCCVGTTSAAKFTRAYRFDLRFRIACAHAPPANIINPRTVLLCCACAVGRTEMERRRDARSGGVSSQFRPVNPG